MSEEDEVVQDPAESASGSRDDYGVGRLLALSDGVFAIAMTLLVLDIRVVPAPARPTGADGIRAFAQALPALLIYGFSFVMVAVYWLNHHRGLRTLRTATGRVLLRNLGLLGLVCVMPFATAFFQRFANTAAGDRVYLGTMFLLGLMSALTVPWRDLARRAAGDHGGRRQAAAIYLSQLGVLPVFALGFLLAGWIPGSAALIVLCLVVALGTARWILRRGVREPRPDPDHYGVSRMLALSDGVFAIALTLLVLNIALPRLGGEATQAQALSVLANRRGQLIGFAITFVVVGLYWTQHHRSLRAVTTLRQHVLGRNLVFLFAVCLVPFVMNFFDAWNATVFGNQFFFAAFGVLAALLAVIRPWRWGIRALLRDGWRGVRRAETPTVALGAIPVCVAGILLAPILGPGNVQLVWVLMAPLALLQRATPAQAEPPGVP